MTQIASGSLSLRAERIPRLAAARYDVVLNGENRQSYHNQMGMVMRYQPPLEY